MSISFLFLYLFPSVVTVFIVYQLFNAWKKNQYWENLGIPHPKPILFFGNLLDLMLKKRTQAEILRDIYDEFPNEPVVGYYHFMSPRLLIRDQDLIERVLIKDFQHFVDRVNFTPPGNPLLINLFGLSGNPWRTMRSKLSPMFTTGKLRHMFPQVSQIADTFTDVLEKKTTNIELKSEISNFTMDVISSCAFGMDPGALQDGESEFRREAKYAFETSFLTFAKRMVLFSVPKLATFLNFKFMPERTENYFGGIVRSSLQHRKKSKLVRNDFVQQMVNLLEKGFIEIENHHPTDDYLNMDTIEESVKLELTDDVMVGQAFVFLLAGFETTATSMNFMCLELAMNQDEQDRAREEIRKVAANGELTYENIRDNTPYLEGCMKESLRLHPPIGHLLRLCVKRYTFPGTSLTIDPGQFVVIPSLSVHGNPDIYPEPQKFRPERWAGSHPPCSYLPFGDGPRICIGMRFATMEIKCCMAKLLLRYKITLNEKVEFPVKIDPYSFFGNPTTPFMFNLERIQSE